MAFNKVEICGVNTAELRSLNRGEREQLMEKMRQGDKDARDAFIRGNLKLVLSVIRRFNVTNENVDDLFQIGCMGLIKAIDNFNPDMGLQLSTYGIPMIMGEIRRYMRDSSTLRVSRALRDTAYRAIYAREHYARVHLKEPTMQEIAEEIGVSQEEITYALDAIQTPISLQEPVYNDSGDALYMMDQISDPGNREEKWVEDMSIASAIDRLDEREKMIIKKRFFQGNTQMEVAEEIQISQAQVSRLEKHALRVMRQFLSA